VKPGLGGKGNQVATARKTYKPVALPLIGTLVGRPH